MINQEYEELDVRSRPLTVATRVTEAEHEAISAAAEDRGTSVDGLIRECLIPKVAQILKGPR